MALTATKFEKASDSLGKGLIDFSADTFKVILLASYTPSTSQTGHQFLSDVKGAGTEASGTGYTAGGATIATVTWAWDTSNARWELHGDIPAWDTTGGSLAGAYAVIYDATPATDATRPVLAVWNLDGAGGTQTSSNGSFDLTESVDGLYYID